MIEFRLLALIGLLAVSVASVVAVLAVFALVGWIGRVRAARVTPPPRSLPSPRASEADRILRTRQAAWRLRC
ncbi:MAG TPA: hypothetical protein VGT40_16185 [Methylomirabilota bacterium]|jgi:hypothetical protein|nr:hypothetical protein [Methylomirabilota bacterium]